MLAPQVRVYLFDAGQILFPCVWVLARCMGHNPKASERGQLDR